MPKSSSITYVIQIYQYEKIELYHKKVDKKNESQQESGQNYVSGGSKNIMTS